MIRPDWKKFVLLRLLHLYNFTVSRLEWLDEAVETKAMAFVYNAREEVISGTLRNNRGTVRIF